nr:MAG TPA: hypothetical protein [Caudoviricetes sp.]
MRIHILVCIYGSLVDLLQISRSTTSKRRASHINLWGVLFCNKSQYVNII